MFLRLLRRSGGRSRSISSQPRYRLLPRSSPSPSLLLSGFCVGSSSMQFSRAHITHRGMFLKFQLGQEFKLSRCVGPSLFVLHFAIRVIQYAKRKSGGIWRTNSERYIKIDRLVTWSKSGGWEQASYRARPFEAIFQSFTYDSVQHESMTRCCARR